jgi:chromosome partitioning protein
VTELGDFDPVSPIDVTPHLGWPAAPVRTPTGLGWPDESAESAAASTAPASAAPEALTPPPPTADDRPTDLLEGDPMPASPDQTAVVSRETTPPVPSSAPAADAGVSRETAPAPSVVPRAADLVPDGHGEHPLGGDHSTPLAQATEHSIAVATGRPLRRQLPRPEQPRVMVVANQKGGVGKTTTTVNVAAALAQHGLKVLVIDLDPQGNASTALSIEHGEGTPGSYQVLVDGTSMDEVIVECPDVPGLFVVPATIDLAGAEIELVSLVARETRLKRALDAHLQECAEVEATYDYVFVDCPPSLGLLTVNALSAGHEMLIPIQCEYYALEGLSQLLHTIEQIREHLNPRLKVGAIMLTMYDARTRLASGVAEEVREHFGEVVLKTAIPRSVRISEAPSYGQTVLTYDPGSAGSLCYLQAASELAQQVTPHQQSTSGANAEAATR